ncbi:hypothetical protein KKI17_00255 [Patescibacteria group bacterium]|nr:hypothetical protein [Patescibacteria group bacterium]
MLQQTQIPRVLPKYEEFLQEFPTLEALAKAHNHKLLSVWKGLGYWKRALALKKTAKIIVGSRATNLRRSFGISLPEQLEKLPASKKILASLEKDGLLKKKRNSYAL